MRALPGEKSRWASALAGSMTGMAMVAFTYPLDIIRTRFAVQTTEKKYTSIAQSAKHMFKNEKGLRTMFRGLSPSLWDGGSDIYRKGEFMGCFHPLNNGGLCVL